MAALVSWRGTIMDAGQGVFTFTPGVRQRGWEITPLLRSDGDAAKKLGISGCTHTVDLKFLSVINVKALLLTLENYCKADGPGTLDVAGHGSYSNCILIENTTPAVIFEPYNIRLSSGMLAMDDRYTVGITLTFRQLR